MTDKNSARQIAAEAARMAIPNDRLCEVGIERETRSLLSDLTFEVTADEERAIEAEVRRLRTRPCYSAKLPPDPR